MTAAFLKKVDPAAAHRPSVTSRREQHWQREIDHRRIIVRARSFRATVQSGPSKMKVQGDPKSSRTSGPVLQPCCPLCSRYVLGLCKTRAVTQILGIPTRSTTFQLSGPVTSIVHFRRILHAPGYVGSHFRVQASSSVPMPRKCFACEQSSRSRPLYASTIAWIRHPHTSALAEQPMLYWSYVSSKKIESTNMASSQKTRSSCKIFLFVAEEIGTTASDSLRFCKYASTTRGKREVHPDECQE